MDFSPFVIAGLSTGAIYVLSGVGLVVLYRASGVLNLAQGAVGALGALITWTIIDAGGPQWIGWISGIAVAAILSLIYGRFIAPRLAHSDPIVRAVATLGFALVVLGVTEIIWGEWPRSLRLPTDTIGFYVWGVRITYTRAIAFILSLGVVLGVSLFIGKTRLGLSMRALANDRDISALVGVPILRVDAWAWLLSGVIAGASGLMLANLVKLQALPLTFMVIPAVAAAVIGRLRSLVGTVIGGLVIGVAEAMAAPFTPIAPFRASAPFVIAILMLLWYQRHGLVLSSMDQFRSVTLARASSQRSGREQLAIGLICVVLAALFVPAIASDYWLKTLTSVVVLSLASLSVSLLYAQLGMVSLCQYAMLGLGGWVALRVSHATGLPFEVALLAGGVSAACFGVIFGLPALRMRGLYLALVTLMIAGAMQIVFNASGFPDGGPGFFGKMLNGQRSFMARPLLGQTDVGYFRYALFVVTVGFILAHWHQRTRPGRAWALIRRSETGAVAAGTNIVAYKVWAFGLSGFLAGTAGALMAASVGQLDGRVFTASESVLLFAVTVVAGAYQWAGQIIAGLLLRAVPALLNDWGVDGNIATIIFGAGLLHALITAPEGIVGQLAGLWRKLWSGPLVLLRERKL